MPSPVWSRHRKELSKVGPTTVCAGQLTLEADRRQAYNCPSPSATSFSFQQVQPFPLCEKSDSGKKEG